MVLTRSLEKAKEAYKRKDVKATIEAHSKKHAEQHKEAGKYIKSMVYGGLDGIITTFAVVAGVTGASLSAGIVLIVGFANLLADGLSMAVGDFLSTKAEREYYRAERKREEWEVDSYPEGEKKEMVELYTDKGLAKKDAESMVKIMSKNKQFWVNIMMVEELGMVEEVASPLKNAIVTFFSFAIFGFVPLVTYVLSYFIPGLRESSFLVASVLTGLTLFTLGAAKIKVTEQNLFRSGIEMLLIGGVAAAAAYGIGYALAGLA